MSTKKELMSLTRVKLDKMAKGLGLTSKDYPNKPKIVAAILKAEKAQAKVETVEEKPAPAPKPKPKPAPNPAATVEVCVNCYFYDPEATECPKTGMTEMRQDPETFTCFKYYHKK